MEGLADPSMSNSLLSYKVNDYEKWRCDEKLQRQNNRTSISRDAPDVTRAMAPHAQLSVVLYTELDDDCDQQSAIGRRL